jgi:hypothetical protein
VWACGLFVTSRNSFLIPPTLQNKIPTYISFWPKCNKYVRIELINLVSCCSDFKSYISCGINARIKTGRIQSWGRNRSYFLPNIMTRIIIRIRIYSHTHELLCWNCARMVMWSVPLTIKNYSLSLLSIIIIIIIIILGKNSLLKCKFCLI